MHPNDTGGSVYYITTYSLWLRDGEGLGRGLQSEEAEANGPTEVKTLPGRIGPDVLLTDGAWRVTDRRTGLTKGYSGKPLNYETWFFDRKWRWADGAKDS